MLISVIFSHSTRCVLTLHVCDPNLMEEVYMIYLGQNLALNDVWNTLPSVYRVKYRQQHMK